MEREQRTRALLANVAWVRALARQLLSDQDTADDVAQEALTLALDRPPKSFSVAGMRSWLSTVTRNLAFQVGRRESARKSVEAAAAPREPRLDSTDRLGLQQSLAQAVLELDEIYRDVVVMRYFDDLPPRDIAIRLGIPGATVRKRLSRALQRIEQTLRRELEADGRDLRDSLSVLVGSATRAAPVGPLPLVVLALAGVFVGALVVNGSIGGPVTAVVRVGAADGPLPGATRVVQLDGDEAHELERDEESGDYLGARSDRGPLVVLPGNRPPQAFDPPKGPEPLELELAEGAWFTGSLYLRGFPPREPLDLRLLVEPPPPELLPESVLSSGIVELEGGALVLRARTADRGYFAFGGLEEDRSSLLLVSDDLRLTFPPDENLHDDGRGIWVVPSRELMWLGATPRSDPRR